MRDFVRNGTEGPRTVATGVRLETLVQKCVARIAKMRGKEQGEGAP